jgi:hypothetical protein
VIRLPLQDLVQEEADSHWSYRAHLGKGTFLHFPLKGQPTDRYSPQDSLTEIACRAADTVSGWSALFIVISQKISLV